MATPAYFKPPPPTATRGCQRQPLTGLSLKTDLGGQRLTITAINTDLTRSTTRQPPRAITAAFSEQCDRGWRQKFKLTHQAITARV